MSSLGLTRTADQPSISDHNEQALIKKRERCTRALQSLRDAAKVLRGRATQQLNLVNENIKEGQEANLRGLEALTASRNLFQKGRNDLVTAGKFLDALNANFDLLQTANEQISEVTDEFISYTNQLADYKKTGN